VLGRNQYLVVEPELRIALDVVKRARRSSAEERTAFVRNPRFSLTQELPEAGESIGTLFVETHQYSERVKGLGLWEKPKLPWLQRKGTGWLPERFVLQIGAREVEMDAASVEALSSAAETARAKEQPEVIYRGASFK